ncbi:hypothetical protein Csa_004284 [Cucumis sativus]|nr:hypothetical protein Csa_004284 [Cucumis sativus]
MNSLGCRRSTVFPRKISKSIFLWRSIKVSKILSTKMAFVPLLRIPMGPFEQKKSVFEDDGLESKASSSPLPKMFPFHVYFYITILLKFLFMLCLDLDCIFTFRVSTTMIDPRVYFSKRKYIVRICGIVL